MYRTFKNKVFITFILIFFVVLGARDIQFNGYTRNYIGLLTAGNNDYSIIQNTFELDIEHSRDNVSFLVNPYIYQYPDKELDFNLREAYLDIYFRAMDIRIGKQQIIWGHADGVFITDVISPKNMEEFLLRDFSEIRMGITSLKANYYFGNKSFEFVWVPTFTPTRFPAENSIWFPERDFSAYPINPTIDRSRLEVEDNLENSEVFAKFSTMSSLIDYEIMAGYMWDDDPTMHVQKSIDPETHQPESITIYPQHHRLSLAGGSFSTTIGSFVVRGEGAFYSGKYFNSLDPKVAEGVVEKDYLHYLVGTDFSLGGVDLSTQFIQEIILDYEEALTDDEFKNTMTFLARDDFLRQKLTVELFSYVGLNNSDALIRPKVYYELDDAFELMFGANFFLGDKGRFGQYNENDMVYTKVTYSF